MRLVIAVPATSHTLVTALEPRGADARKHSWPGVGRDSALRWHCCCLLLGQARAASLSLVLGLRWLAGYGSPRNAAFHFQCLRPAFVLIGVPTVLHVLRGQGAGRHNLSLGHRR